jgi:formylglycine-generating enzyme required for sulfatase activity
MMSRTIRCVVAAAVLSLCSTMGAAAQSCNADINRDGVVDGKDLAAVLSAWGVCQPNITSISPQQGTISGGTIVTITGDNLTGIKAITFGGASGTELTVISSTQVRVVTPPGTVGKAEVAASGSWGTVTVPGGFNYLSVTIPAWATLIEANPDPLVVTSASLRSLIGTTGLAWRVRDTATQIEFVLIPPGTFQMGCSSSKVYSCFTREHPVHYVTLTQPFYMGRYEVTQAQWVSQMGSNPSYFVPANGYPQSQQRPVERVSWNTIQGFLSATGMRLPSEAEWEFAYRAGTTTAFHSMPGHPDGFIDDSWVGSIAWYALNWDGGFQTRQVGQKAGNGFGLHDMSGNVYELVHDWYGAYSADDQTDPTGPDTGLTRVYRGGSWDTDSHALRASYRDSVSPSASVYYQIGFRVARNP